MVCCAKVMADEMREAYPDKDIACLYNPFDLARIEEMENEPLSEEHERFFDSDAPVIVSVGRADDLKGFWHLLKSLYFIKEEIPETKVVIVGDGDYSIYEKLASDLGIREQVLFTGVQKNPFKYVKRSDVYALTSRAEGFPNAMVEAMAVGIAVMSVNCKTGPAEILADDYKRVQDQHQVHEGEYGILLPVVDPIRNLDPTDFEEGERVFANEFIKLIRDEERLKKLAEEAKKRSRNYAMESYLTSILEMME